VKATYAALASFGAPLDNIAVRDFGDRSLWIFSPGSTAFFSMKHGNGAWNEDIREASEPERA